MPQARIRNSRCGSGDPSTELPLRVRAEQDDPAIRLDRSEAKDLGHERTNLTRREVRHRDDGSTDEIASRVPRLNGRGRPSHTMGSEIDSQLIRRIAGLREIVGGNDSADAHLDFLKSLEGNGGHSLRRRGTASLDLTLSGKGRTGRHASGRGNRSRGHRVDDTAVRVPPDSSTRLGDSRQSLGPTSLACGRSEEHTSELQSPCNLVCRLLLEKKKKKIR